MTGITIRWPPEDIRDIIGKASTIVGVVSWDTELSHDFPIIESCRINLPLYSESKVRNFHET